MVEYTDLFVWLIVDLFSCILILHVFKQTQQEYMLCKRTCLLYRKVNDRKCTTLVNVEIFAGGFLKIFNQTIMILDFKRV